MVKRFADNSNYPARALQIWLILIGQARLRRTMTYGELDRQMNYGSAQLGGILDYIFKYCKANGLPPLALIVVNKDTGKPGEWSGMDPTVDMPQNDAVFTFDWYSIFPPTPEELKAAHK